MPAPTPVVHVEFCGVWHRVEPDQVFRIGREGDLAVDDNPYLHRTFLEVHHDRIWWLANVGNRLSAAVSDGDGDGLHAWLAPGTALPLVVRSTEVRFSAGPTSYELTCLLDQPLMTIESGPRVTSGATTRTPMDLTANQRLLVLSLTEAALRDPRAGTSRVPPSAEAAARLGWTITKFNRQLDAVCQKLARSGVAGVQGDQATLASGRRARLVEYALAVRLVTADDLALLTANEGAGADRHEGETWHGG